MAMPGVVVDGRLAHDGGLPWEEGVVEWCANALIATI
jgi:hypothetical protein